MSQYIGGQIIGKFLVPAKEAEMARSLFSRTRPYGSALAFQAFMEEPDLLEYHTRHPLDEGSLAYWKSFELLDGMLAQVRLEGHLAFVKGGMFRAAAPIFGSGKTASGMISLTKPFEEMKSGEAQECIDLVRQAADELSLALRQGADTGALPKGRDSAPARSRRTLRHA